MKPYFFLSLLLCFSCSHKPSSVQSEPIEYPAHLKVVLENTRPLTHPQGKRLPLYVWPASNAGPMSDEQASNLIEEMNERGIGLFTSWRKQEDINDYLTIAKAQHNLGVKVNIDATTPMYSFFDGSEQTAHIDHEGNPFFDESFGGPKMGCPFKLHNRKEEIKKRIEFYVNAYKEAGLMIDFIFADWEVDGPIEVNKAFESSRRCVCCCEHLGKDFTFESFSKAMREMRSYLQNYTYSSPVLSAFPSALVGNYAIYPNDGYRYWYDYFEKLEPYQPHIREQNATYRRWHNDFPHTGYTFAMPVIYPWDQIFYWYDFKNTDYRWFYNMLKVGTNACKSTPQHIPVISFIHWNTVFVSTGKVDPDVKQMSKESYQELLWHLLFRGTDGFFMWCMESEYAEEVRLAHEVYAASLSFSEFLDEGTPITFDIPSTPGTVISGLMLGDRVLVRRTDFADNDADVKVMAGTKQITIRPMKGCCQVISLK